MCKYVIKVEPTGELNPEYYPDERIRNGVETDGYFMISFNDSNPKMVCMEGVSIMDLAEWLADSKDEATINLKQAFAISEGLEKSRKILSDYRRMDLIKNILGGEDNE